MVHSLKPAIITDDNNPTDIEFILGKTINFGSMEFITDGISNLSLSPEGNDSGAV
jgi:hypothetical protein